MEPNCVSDAVNELEHGFDKVVRLEDDGDYTEANDLKSYSFNVSSKKIVSAMKGSREKRGVSRVKLTVTWSSNVYDPIPTSQSHSVKGHGKKYRKEKEGKKSKKGQKGNSKGKKQQQKQVIQSQSGKSAINDFCSSSLLQDSPAKFQFLLC